MRRPSGKIQIEEIEGKKDEDLVCIQELVNRLIDCVTYTQVVQDNKSFILQLEVRNFNPPSPKILFSEIKFLFGTRIVQIHQEPKHFLKYLTENLYPKCYFP